MSEKLSNSEKALLIAKKFIEEKDIINFNKSFYLFHEGVWREESDENTEAWVTMEYMKRFGAPRSSQVREVIKYIKDLTYEAYRKEIKYHSEYNIKNEINIKGGILDLDKMEVIEYTKESFRFHKLPFDFNPEAKCPLMMKFLSSSMGYDIENITQEELPEFKKTMRFIQEWMGYTLLPGNRLHKSLIMVGEGRNGKGVLQHIWAKILGDHNVSYVDLKYLNDGSQIFLTRNKLVNFSSDLEGGQQLDTGVVKSAVSGERVIANEKYKGQIPIDFTAKIIVACNEMPFVRNIGAAIKERFYVLPFDRVFQEHERDPDLKYKLEDEVEEIFSWAVQGLNRLRKRKYFDPPQKCLLSTEDYIKSNDSILMWIEEDKIRCEGEKTKRSETYRHYVQFCRDSGLKPLGKHKFYSKVKRRGYEILKTDGGTVFFLDMKMPNSISTNI